MWTISLINIRYSIKRTNNCYKVQPGVQPVLFLEFRITINSAMHYDVTRAKISGSCSKHRVDDANLARNVKVNISFTQRSFALTYFLTTFPDIFHLWETHSRTISLSVS